MAAKIIAGIKVEDVRYWMGQRCVVRQADPATPVVELENGTRKVLPIGELHHTMAESMPPEEVRRVAPPPVLPAPPPAAKVVVSAPPAPAKVDASPPPPAGRVEPAPPVVQAAAPAIPVGSYAGRANPNHPDMKACPIEGCRYRAFNIGPHLRLAHNTSTGELRGLRPPSPPAPAPAAPATPAPKPAPPTGIGPGFLLGSCQLQLDITVNFGEMNAWSPERIAAFFNGLAQVIAAKEGA